MSDCIITEKLRKRLGLPFTKKMNCTLDTALPSGKLKKLGNTEPVKLYIGNARSHYEITPMVVENMSDPINIGSQFLSKLSKTCSNVCIRFDQGEPRLEIGRDKEQLVQLIEPEESMKQNNLETENNKQAIEKDSKQNDDLNPRRPRMRGNVTLNRSQMHRIVECCVATQDTVLAPSKLTFVKTINNLNKEAEKQELLHVEPVKGKDYQTIPGIYKTSFGKIAILNHTKSPIVIRQGERIANISAVLEKEYEYKDTEEKVTKLNLTERNASTLVEQLKIHQNKVLQGNPKAKQKLLELVQKYKDVFTDPELNPGIGKTSLVEFDIRLVPNAKPTTQRLRPLNPAQKDDLKKTIKNWEKDGIIEPAPPHCEWSSAVVPVLKKTGEIRWCVDYRDLNSKTVGDKYPLPSIEENIEALRGSTYYSTLDAASAYHQIPVAPEARKYLAFVTPHGLWTFSRMPFGAKNSGATYSRFVKMVLDQLNDPAVLAYLDDVIVHNSDLMEHMETLEKVLEAHRKAGIRLRPSKTFLVHQEIDYLGFHISKGDHVSMIEAYVEKILDWPTPTNKKELSSFLGFTSYYRSFISDYSFLTNEMNDAKKEDQAFEWTETMDEKFKKLKQKFAERPIRAFPDYESDQPFQLSVDFSAENLGAMLTQEQNGQERLIAVAGRKTTKYEKNYHSTKGELAAVVYGLRKFEHLLRFKKFILYTDNSSIVWLREAKRPRGIIFRWLTELISYDFEVRHRPGKQNVCADALSRSPHMDPPSQSDNEEENEYVYRVREYLEKLDLIGDMLEVENDDEQPDLEIENIEDDTDLENIKEAQKEDPILREVREWCSRGQKPSKEELRGKPIMLKHYAQEFECLSLRDDVLYYTKEIQAIQDKPVIRIVLPERKHRAMFKHVHEDLHSGHFGQRATCLKAISRFYWPGIWGDVKEMVAKCEHCISKKTQPNTKDAIHHPVITRGFPGEIIYIDLVGPLNVTAEQNRYILTVEDGYSRFSQAFPIRNKEAVTVAKALYDGYISVFGPPYQIYSDNGLEFVNRVLQELADRWQIKKTTSAPYCPHSNLVERFHRTLNQFFRTTVDREELQWDRYLKSAVLAYNTKIHSSTGYTPYRVTFGRECRLPLDLLIPLPGPEPVDMHDYVKATQNSYKTMFQYIRTNQQNTIKRNAKYYQNTQRFKVGALVWYLSPVRINEKPTKFTDNWLGPYTITSKETETIFVIKPLAGGRTLKVHCSRLEPIKDPRYLIQARTPRNVEMVEGDELAEELEFAPVGNAPRIPIQNVGDVELMVDLTRRGPGRPKKQSLERPQPNPPDNVVEPQPGPSGIKIPEPQPLPDTDDEMIRGNKRAGEDIPGPTRDIRPRKEGTKRPFWSHSDSDESSEDNRPGRRLKKDSYSPKFLDNEDQRILPVGTPDSSDSEGIDNIRQQLVNVQISDDSTIPREAMQGSAVYDVCAKRKVTLKPREVTKVDININKVKIPDGYLLHLISRSGLSCKGIFTLPGIVDPNSVGPVYCLLYNSTDTSFVISKGQRISQCYLQPLTSVNWNHVKHIPQPHAENPYLGFGSISHMCERCINVLS